MVEEIGTSKSKKKFGIKSLQQLMFLEGSVIRKYLYVYNDYKYINVFLTIMKENLLINNRCDYFL